MNHGLRLIQMLLSRSVSSLQSFKNTHTRHLLLPRASVEPESLIGRFSIEYVFSKKGKDLKVVL